MLFAELIPLAGCCAAIGHHITIETAGTLYLPVACDLMSISPKLSNSTPLAKSAIHAGIGGTKRRGMCPTWCGGCMSEYEYQLKFVIDTPADCDEVKTIWTSFRRSIVAACC